MTADGGHAFLPWLRTGLGVRAAPGTGGRTSLQISVALNQATPGATPRNTQVELQLFDAGDVVGFDSRAVIRTYPAPDVGDAEPDYFPLIELDPPDLPWRLTPEAADGDKLKPWLVLLALRTDELTGDQPVQPLRDASGAVVQPSGGDPSAQTLPSITVPFSSLPDLSESWAWAHVSVAGKQSFPGGQSDIQAYLAQSPGQFAARLFSPRRLQPATSYVACLVPAFKRGRLAGLGQGAADSIPANAPAWPDSDVTGTDLQLPVYFRWSFQTGNGDFEQLARKLKPMPEPLPARLGRRAVDMSTPGEDLPPASTPLLHLGGAVMAPKDPSATDEWSGAEVKPFIDGITALLNEPSRRQGATLAPPLYGSAQTGLNALGGKSDPPWLATLNTDPRLRTAAGAGADLVRTERDALLASAWSQADGIRNTNAQYRQAQLGRELATTLHTRAMKAEPARLLQFAAPVLARLPSGGTTLHSQISATPLATPLLDPRWRKTATAVAKRMQAKPAAPGSAPSAPTNTAAVATMVNAGNLQLTSQPRVLASFASKQPPAASPPPPAPMFSLSDLHAQVAAALDPKATIEAPFLARSIAPANISQVSSSDALAPLHSAPVFPTPLMPALAKASQAWVLPGLDAIPPNSALLLQPNTAFIEAFLAGANHELARQLLWAEYPTNPRATYFFNFWDGAPPGSQDILPIDQWRAALGSNAAATATAGSGLLLLLRADLLLRFPGAQVTAVRATSGPGGQRGLSANASDQLAPTLRGDLGSDISFLAFSELPLADAQSEPGWFFVIHEPLTAPRFGLDPDPTGASTTAKEENISAADLAAPPAGSSAPTGASSAQIASNRRRAPVRLAIHASLLLAPVGGSTT